MRTSVTLSLTACLLCFVPSAFAQLDAQIEEVQIKEVQTKDSQRGEMVLVVGAGGTDEYTKTFAEWADQWKQLATRANLQFSEPAGDGTNRDWLKQQLAECGDSESPLWVVLIGHGTSDRNVTKFNLRGPDVSGTELKEWLAACKRPVILANCFSCSGGWLKDVQGPNRVVITATSSGAELNYSRFGGFLAESVADSSADLDHDEQVSLLEAFLLASSKVERFYESESRLATEHALLEDNQDGKGTPAKFFTGIRAEGRAKDGSLPDGRMAHRYILVPSKNAPKLSQEEVAERDRLESEIEKLRSRKRKLGEDAYYEELEKLMVQMAELYDDT